MAKKKEELEANYARALELLDNCVIAAERDDENLILQTAGAGREFLDTLSSEEQALFRDWHEPGVELRKAKLG
jgi:hypothetical protein